MKIRGPENAEPLVGSGTEFGVAVSVPEVLHLFCISLSDAGLDHELRNLESSGSFRDVDIQTDVENIMGGSHHKSRNARNAQGYE